MGMVLPTSLFVLSNHVRSQYIANRTFLIVAVVAVLHMYVAELRMKLVVCACKHTCICQVAECS